MRLAQKYHWEEQNNSGLKSGDISHQAEGVNRDIVQSYASFDSIARGLFAFSSPRAEELMKGIAPWGKIAELPVSLTRRLFYLSVDVSILRSSL